jgi:tetratricopeptide (TPR) repeat protein
MTGMSGEIKERFEELRAGGIRAKNEENHIAAAELFSMADAIAQEHDDQRQRLDALNPLALALVRIDRLDEALDALVDAEEIANGLKLEDQQAMVATNLGRLYAIYARVSVEAVQLPHTLKETAVPHLVTALDLFQDHIARTRGEGHNYFPYQAAKHGSIIAAVAEDYQMTRGWLALGYSLADMRSSAEHGREKPIEIDPQALGHFAVAAQVVNLGTKNPRPAEFSAAERHARLYIA